jgi:hypothetical protein
MGTKSLCLPDCVVQIHRRRALVQSDSRKPRIGQIGETDETLRLDYFVPSDPDQCGEVEAEREVDPIVVLVRRRPCPETSRDGLRHPSQADCLGCRVALACAPDFDRSATGALGAVLEVVRQTPEGLRMFCFGETAGATGRNCRSTQRRHRAGDRQFRCIGKASDSRLRRESQLCSQHRGARILRQVDPAGSGGKRSRNLCVGRSPLVRSARTAVEELRHATRLQFFFDVPSCTPYYGQAVAAIVPILSGGGARTKIIESFAHRCPVIPTTKGCEGLEVAHQGASADRG